MPGDKVDRPILSQDQTAATTPAAEEHLEAKFNVVHIHDKP